MVKVGDYHSGVNARKKKKGKVKKEKDCVPKNAMVTEEEKIVVLEVGKVVNDILPVVGIWERQWWWSSWCSVGDRWWWIR